MGKSAFASQILYSTGCDADLLGITHNRLPTGGEKKKPLGKSWAPYTTMLPTVAKREMGNAGRREDGGCIILGGKRQRGDGKGEKGEDGRNDRIKIFAKIDSFCI